MPHVLDMLLEDIGKILFFKSVIKRAAALRKFVLSTFRTVSVGELTNPGATRFKTVHIGLTNLVHHRHAIAQALVVESVHKAVKAACADTVALHKEAKAICDEDFWADAELVDTIMSPIARLLTYCDGGAPTMSKVHYTMFQVHEKIKGIDMDEDMKEDIITLVGARWDYGFNAIQDAGFVLDPEFQLCPSDAETMKAFRTMVDKTYSLPADLEGDEDAAACDTHAAATTLAYEKRARAEEQLTYYKQWCLGAHPSSATCSSSPPRTGGSRTATRLSWRGLLSACAVASTALALPSVGTVRWTSC
jgi:hypothetical protein